MISKREVLESIKEHPHSTCFAMLKYEQNVRKNLPLRITVEYDKRRVHEIKLVVENSMLTWYVVPYKRSYFRTRANYDDMLAILLYVIKEHDDD